MFDLDELLDRFELLWREGEQQPGLDQFVEQSSIPAEERVASLLELIPLDMEYRWRKAGSLKTSAEHDTAGIVAAASEETVPELLSPRPLVEDYARRWPEILQDGPPIGLIVEEYRIRQRWGDRPEMSLYVERFGDSSELRSGLELVHHQLTRDEGEAPTLPRRLEETPDEFPSGPDLETTLPEFPQQSRYRILKRLGTGGMGEVFLAEDTQLERQVALKTPHLEDDERLRERFFNEARAAATLHHPGICPVFDAGDFDGRPFLTMAYIEGRTLREQWASEDDRSVVKTLSLFSRIAQAMQAAHDAGIVHRDLKPSNVMIDGGGNPVVMDFGLAFRENLPDSDRITQSGETFGSPGYMSPEQVEGPAGDVSAASDIYSLGVMLFEALTGRLPFTGSVSSILVKIARDAPPLLSKIREGVDSELEQLCLQMQEKDPAKRPASMSEVADRLEAIAHRLPADPQSVSEGPGQVSHSQVSTQWEQSPRRTKPALIAAALVPIVILLGVIVFNIKTPYGPVRIEVEEQFADQIKVRVLQEGKVVEIADTESGWSLSLEEGQYEFELAKGGEQFEISPRRVTVSREDEAVVSVSFLVKSGPPKIPDIPAGTGQQSGFALSFDGIDDHVVTPVVYDGSHPITIEAWVAPANPFGTGRIISNDEVTAKGISLGQRFVGKHHVRKWSSSVRDKSKNPSWVEPQVDSLSIQQRRVHVAVCWDRRHLSLFLNGKQTGEYYRDELKEMPSVDLPFLIGTCYRSLAPSAMTDHCFHGVIDEVRISNVARYSDGEFTPKERFEVDDQTIALYHFDEAEGETVLDSSKNENHARIVGARRVSAMSMYTPGPFAAAIEKFRSESTRSVPARSGPALLFGGNGQYASSPQLDTDFSRPFTLETWFTPLKSDLRVKRTIVGVEGIRIWSFDDFHAGIIRPLRQVSAVSGPPRSIQDGKRTHLAMQWTGQIFELFVNGRKSPYPVHTFDPGDSEKVTDTELIRRSLQEAKGQALIIGVPGEASSSMVVDRVRLSRGIRYTRDFEPVDFQSDENTVVLYDFHEGQGEVLHDVSGNGHDAKITGGEWLAAPSEPEDDGYVRSLRRKDARRLGN